MIVLCEQGKITDHCTSIAGIYFWKNNLNGKGYVGQSNDMRKRICSYRKYRFSKQRKLYAAVQKYGLENFTCYKVMDCCQSKVALNYWEKYWIKELDTFGPNGYNLTTGGDSAYSRSIETRERLSRRTITPEWRRKIGISNSGRIIDAEWKKNISIATKKAMARPEVLAKVRLASSLRSGIPISESALLIRVGRQVSEETRTKIGNANRGKKNSKETIGKMKMAKTGNKNPRYGIKETESTKMKKRKSMMVALGTLWKDFFIYE